MTTVGLVLTAVGIYLYYDMERFEKTSMSARGVVIDMTGKPGGKSAPVIQFTDANGYRQTFVSRSSSKPPKYEVNDNVDVVYASSRTGGGFDAYVNDKWNILIRKFGVLAFGLLFLVLGIVFGRMFWNRDSMYIGIAYSKDVDITEGTANEKDA